MVNYKRKYCYSMGGKTKRAMLNEPDCVRSANGSVG